MRNLQKYIAKHKATDLVFAEGFDSGYEDFKIVILLRLAREFAELTEEEEALQLGTKKFGDLEP
jgi:HTH-type transcriptional regulator / antitoxin HipB